MEYLYHGSAVPGIQALEARSTLHGTDRRIVYLTDNIPYALLYVWDEGLTGSPVKHVTGWVKGGTAHYEEQFPHQLERFYRGAQGWLYRTPKGDAQAVEGREGLFYAEGDIPVETAYIPDVYEALLRHEAAGELRVFRFAEQAEKAREELTSRIAELIIRADFYRADSVQRAFMQKYFTQAWEKAETQLTADS